MRFADARATFVENPTSRLSVEKSFRPREASDSPGFLQKRCGSKVTPNGPATFCEDLALPRESNDDSFQGGERGHG
jgi:hypothetical protein